jgi:hypothetical protein
MAIETNFGDLVRGEDGKIKFVPNPNGKYWMPPPGFEPVHGEATRPFATMGKGRDPYIPKPGPAPPPSPSAPVCPTKNNEL